MQISPPVFTKPPPAFTDRFRAAVALAQAIHEGQQRPGTGIPYLAHLLVVTSTIRTHLRHIYAKLGAHGRADAVARARQLGLLAPFSGSR